MYHRKSSNEEQELRKRGMFLYQFVKNLPSKKKSKFHQVFQFLSDLKNRRR